jgi:DNA polymerase-1
MPPRLYVIDSHGQLYASFFAIGGLTTPRGEPIGAVFGFVGTLLKVLREEKPEYLAACFDLPGPTHRHEAFDQYKAQRKPMPDDLRPQVEKVREVLGLMRIPVIDSPGYEADDCIAAMVRRGREAGMDVVIVTRDKDLEQLVGPGVTVLDARTFEHLDPAGIKTRRGVEPGQVADVLALMGDASDNIPGVPGVGPKTAVKLIAEYGSLDNLLSHADEVKGKMGERLRVHRDDALRSRSLVVLDADVPLDLDLEACRTPQSFDAERLVGMFREMGFNKYIEEFDLGAPAGAGGARTAFRTRVADTPEALADLARQMAAQPAFAFDTETTGLRIDEARLVGVSVAWQADEGWYVPILAPEGERTVTLEAVRDALGPILAGKIALPPPPSPASDGPKRRKVRAKDAGPGLFDDPAPDVAEAGAACGASSPRRLLIGQNVKFDMLICRRAGLDLAEPLFDTMVAAYLVNPGRREYGLDALVLDAFGHKMIPITDLLGPKCKDCTMDQVAVARVAEYAAEDAVMTWRLWERLEKDLAAKGLASLARDVEMPLVPVLAAMEDAGVAVDLAVLSEISADLESRLARLERDIYGAAGHEFAINSPQQLGQVLFDELDLKSVKKTTVGKRPSTDAAVLEDLARLHPLPRLVLEYRQLAKLKGTYVDALPSLAGPPDGRIHTSFNQTATATGRLSSSEPNLQNIPIRTDEGRQIRRAFVPGRPGWLLLAADYSQIELRMLAHYSDDPALVRAFAEDRDIHTFVAAQIHGVTEAEVTAEMRRVAKVVNFSLIYGKTAYGLSRDLGIGVGEAERFIDEYFARYQGVRTFTAQVLERAKADGYVTTILGRRRPVEGIDQMDLKRLNFPERTALNTVIQGSAADLIKVAMNRIWRRIAREGRPSRLLIQIHDELIFETPASAVEDEQRWIVDEMTSAIALKVPLRVHVAAGKNWMEAE